MHVVLGFFARLLGPRLVRRVLQTRAVQQNDRLNRLLAVSTDAADTVERFNRRLAVVAIVGVVLLTCLAVAVIVGIAQIVS